jgi:hypothetical protein
MVGSFNNRSSTFNNFGLLSIEYTGGQLLNRATFNNKPCGRAIVKIGTISNNISGSVYLNEGFTQANNSLNSPSPGIFTNNGTLIYGSVTGTITNATAPSLIVNNNAPASGIFTYGGTYNGTIIGIFTDANATVSAGTFTAPNTFTPSGSLSGGSQTLYAKVTPNGGACFYVVPFTFVNTVVTITSITTGNWESASTWNLGRVPLATDNVVIDQTHTVTITTNGATAKNVEYRPNAVLNFANSVASLSLLGGI